MKPTVNQIDAALVAAEELRDLGVDKDHLGESLLYLHRRNVLLEELLTHVELYLRFGQPEEEHAKLNRLLDKIRYQSQRESGEEAERMGL